MIRQAKQGENAASDKRGHGVVRGAGVETTAEARLPQSRTGENQGILGGPNGGRVMGCVGCFGYKRVEAYRTMQ